jgi:cytochrome P450
LQVVLAARLRLGDRQPQNTSNGTSGAHDLDREDPGPGRSRSRTPTKEDVDMQPVAKPSDFPRDAKFRDEKGVYHVFSYADVMRVLINRGAAFSRDPSPWLPPGPHHMALDFMWAVEPFTLEGEHGRHDALRRVVEPWFKLRAVGQMEPVIRELAFS